jgi:hypothetical protein
MSALSTPDYYSLPLPDTTAWIRPQGYKSLAKQRLVIYLVAAI